MQDKLQQSIAAFVGKKLGPKFAESPNATMEDIYRGMYVLLTWFVANQNITNVHFLTHKDLDNKTPCIFVLSSGADPTGGFDYEYHTMYFLPK